jgi:hypothetical protein
VYRSTGASFEAGVIGNLGEPVTPIGDLKGDGRTDLATVDGKVAISDGNGFTMRGVVDYYCPMRAGDVDGDGAVEIICNKPGSSSGPQDITVRKWTGTALSAPVAWTASTCHGSIFTGDYNGDGKTDIVCNEQTNAAGDAEVLLWTAGTSGLRADLVEEVTGPLGGQTEVAWVPGTTYSSPSDNSPVVKPVVQSVSVHDGRGGVSTTSFSYEGAFYHRAERRFLGYRKFRKTLPCLPGESACPYVESTFKQDLYSPGRPERIERRNGAAHLLSASAFEYTTNTPAVPRTSYVTGEWSETLDGEGGSCPSWPCASGKRTYQGHLYDTYGNRTQTTLHGDFDVSGDETTTVFEYRPNSAAYVVDRVAREHVYAGTSAGGTKLSERRYHYDHSSTWDAPPTQGLLTTASAWLDTEDRYLARGFGYDRPPTRRAAPPSPATTWGPTSSRSPSPTTPARRRPWPGTPCAGCPRRGPT